MKDQIRFLRHMLQSCNENKAGRNNYQLLYDSVGRVIPRQVARQHCPTAFRPTVKVTK